MFISIFMAKILLWQMENKRENSNAMTVKLEHIYRLLYGIPIDSNEGIIKWLLLKLFI